MVKGEICQVEGCTNILTKTSGRICQMHRTRMFRHGSYELPPNKRSAKYGKPCVSKLGYVRININGKRVLEHRYIMEQYLGRELTRKETIHHINGDKADNRIENLELFFNNKEHMKECHPDCWKQRTIHGEVSPEVIHQIIERVYIDGGTFNTCFCGGSIIGRNLCDKHYQWAWRHKLFQPNRKQKHYDGVHHSAE